MKTAIYIGLDGKPFKVEYDPDAPCKLCGKPVIEASMGGTVICPWCDTGKPRPGETDKDTDWRFRFHGDSPLEEEEQYGR